MIKKLCGFLLLISIIVFNSDIFLSQPVMAANSMDVVISEIAWAGSLDNSLDEWIELYNNTTSPIDINNWKIEDDGGAQIYTLSGIIPAHGYFLLESRELSTSIPADQIRTLSLSNNGDSEILKDNDNNTIDTVNSTSGAWFAGSTTNHTTMERLSTTISGDISSNWQSSGGGTTSTSSLGTVIQGTPKANNSGTTVDPQITITPDKTSASTSEQIAFTVAINNAINISNYGFDITYDPNNLHYLQSSEKTFLNENSTVETSFQSGLENNNEGTVVLGNARTITPLTGVSGNGELFTINFEIKNSASVGLTSIEINNTSFLSSPIGNIAITSWPSSSFTITEPPTNAPVTHLQTNPGTDRYSIALQWDTSSGTNVSYNIYRRNPHGTFDLLGTSTVATFIDHDSISHGGNIIPNLAYEYQVTVMNGTEESTPTTVAGTDNRGLKGDNNRTDRVDGHDLENIAKSWTIDDSQTEFPPLVDTSFDGTINGNDLIDLAVTWARTYS